MQIDEDILQEVIKMGFDRAALVESIGNRVQNEVTLLLHVVNIVKVTCFFFYHDF